MFLTPRNLIFLLLCAVAPWQGAIAETKSISLKQLINVSGSQRMLSQRLVKSYCQIGLGVFPQDSVKAIAQDVERFESQLNLLKRASDNPIYQEMLEWTTLAWERFKPLVQGAVQRDHVLRINHLAEDLLYTADQLTMLLQDSTNQREEMLVNVSGRQRMLAQRLAKLYMMKSWGFDYLSLNNEMDRIKNSYEHEIERLRAAPESTDKIRASLEEVMVQWIWFKSALERQGEPAYRLVVADASDTLLTMMDSITAQYAAMNYSFPRRTGALRETQ